MRAIQVLVAVSLMGLSLTALAPTATATDGPAVQVPKQTCDDVAKKIAVDGLEYEGNCEWSLDEDHFTCTYDHFCPPKPGSTSAPDWPPTVCIHPIGC